MFRIKGLDPARFAHLLGADDATLAAAGARRYSVDAAPGFPDRIAVRDLEPGETAILLNFDHQPAPTPYRAAHAIFVGEHGEPACDVVGTVPTALRRRPISLRGFDAGGEMTGAELVAGVALEGAIARLLAAPATAYLHAHYAVRGCYAARIERA